jgi:hypothetical protein
VNSKVKLLILAPVFCILLPFIETTQITNVFNNNFIYLALFPVIQTIIAIQQNKFNVRSIPPILFIMALIGFGLEIGRVIIFIYVFIQLVLGSNRNGKYFIEKNLFLLWLPFVVDVVLDMKNVIFLGEIISTKYIIASLIVFILTILVIWKNCRNDQLMNFELFYLHFYQLYLLESLNIKIYFIALHIVLFILVRTSMKETKIYLNELMYGLSPILLYNYDNHPMVNVFLIFLILTLAMNIRHFIEFKYKKYINMYVIGSSTVGTITMANFSIASFYSKTIIIGAFVSLLLIKNKKIKNFIKYRGDSIVQNYLISLVLGIIIGCVYIVSTETYRLKQENDLMILSVIFMAALLYIVAKYIPKNQYEQRNYLSKNLLNKPINLAETNGQIIDFFYQVILSVGSIYSYKYIKSLLIAFIFLYTMVVVN